jgi:hypothetical protein
MKKGNRFIFIMLSLLLIAMSSGIYFSQHNCSQCGESEVFFFSKAECLCQDADCCSTETLCSLDNEQKPHTMECEHDCSVSSSFFSIPTFPTFITKSPIPLEVELDLDYSDIQDLSSLNLLKSNLFEQSAHSPPILSKIINFVIYSQRQILYS